jgi:hypothetical protein
MLIKLFFISIMLIFFSGCQSTKDFFTLSKKNQSDEFLIEKKNPLTLPPDYGKLPVPGKSDENLMTDKDQDIKSIIGDNKISDNNNNDNDTVPSAIEKLILDKINEID